MHYPLAKRNEPMVASNRRRVGKSKLSQSQTHTGEISMSNKNPFEIRADMLQMAKDYMDRQWEMNYSFTQQLFDQGKNNIEDVQQALKPYSTEELMKKATEMYSFVTKKD
jgi:propanediol dehydratase small subunit